MKKKKKAKKIIANRITVKDYIKAIKKADREIQLSQSAGWTAKTSVHKNKKIYNRKTEKKNYLNE